MRRIFVLLAQVLDRTHRHVLRQPQKCGNPVPQSVNGKNHHQRKKRATVLIARFPLLYWCRKEESNPRPSHYE